MRRLLSQRQGEWGMQPTMIVADAREQGGALFAVLSGHPDVTLKVRHLLVGDYHVEGVVVERKTAADLALSIVDRRLFRQARALAVCRQRAVLLIEGDLAAHRVDVSRASIDGALVAVAVRWGLPMLMSVDAAHSARLLLSLAGQQVRRSEGYWLRPGRAPRRGDRKTYVLQGLAGVGGELARRLMSRFGTIAAVTAASEADLLEVPGVGPRRAHQIYDALHEDRVPYAAAGRAQMQEARIS